MNGSIAGGVYNDIMRKLLMVIMVLGVASLALGVQPTLTARQREQLATATDYSQQLDEAAWYPLLENVAGLDVTDKAGARYPDLVTLLTEPAAYRGELFVVEGLLAAPPRTLPRTARPGTWSGKLQQWVIQTDAQRDEVVLLYLVDPPSDATRPKVGDAVWTIARFFKVWDETRAADGKMRRYAVFVGRTVNRGGPGAGEAGGAGGVGKGGGSIGLGGGFTALVVAVVVLAGGFYYLRKRIAAQNSIDCDVPSRRENRHERGEDEAAEEDIGDPLPEDPVEALRELERRKTEIEG